MSESEWPEPAVSGLTAQELVDLFDSLDPNWVGRFDSFEALVRYAEAGEIHQKLEAPASNRFKSLHGMAP